jgi:hypothetical protein
MEDGPRPTGRRAACSRLLGIQFIVLLACGPRGDEVVRVHVSETVSVDVPEGWNDQPSQVGALLRPSNGPADDSIQVTAVERVHNGFVRTADAAMDAVRTQAMTFPYYKEIGQRKEQHSNYLEWTYRTPTGESRSRRHWVTEGHNATVHISCTSAATGTTWSVCDQVAHSVTETTLNKDRGQ